VAKVIVLCLGITLQSHHRSYYDNLSVKLDTAKVWPPYFSIKITLLSQATGFVFSGNLLAFDVIGSKACKIVCDATADTQLLILLPMEMR